MVVNARNHAVMFGSLRQMVPIERLLKKSVNSLLPLIVGDFRTAGAEKIELRTVRCRLGQTRGWARRCLDVLRNVAGRCKHRHYNTYTSSHCFNFDTRRRRLWTAWF